MYNAKLQKFFVTLSIIYDKEVIKIIRILRDRPDADWKLQL